MWIGVLQQSPQCGNMRHAMTDPYYLRCFLQVEGKKKKKRCIFLQVSICKQGHFHVSFIEESPYIKTKLSITLKFPITE